MASWLLFAGSICWLLVALNGSGYWLLVTSGGFLNLLVALFLVKSLRPPLLEDSQKIIAEGLSFFRQENLGFLSISQALADYAMLVRHVQARQHVADVFSLVQCGVILCRCSAT